MKPLEVMTLEQAQTMMREHRVMVVEERGVSFFEGKAIVFSQFGAKPEFGEVAAGAKKFVELECDFLVAVGKRGAIDIAKGIKYLLRKNIPFLAIPPIGQLGSHWTELELAAARAVPTFEAFQYRISHCHRRRRSQRFASVGQKNHR